MLRQAQHERGGVTSTERGWVSDTPIIPAIQLLRALAAGSVAVVHLAFAFSDHIGSSLGLPASDGQVAQAAVALFFLVSGYIMVVTAAPLFGTSGGSARFWRRRAIRIFPPYWLATGLLVAIFLWLGRSVDGGDLLRSLVLWPFFPPSGGQPLPLLWPGWTLFHELVFYALFGIGISMGKTRALGIAAGVILALIAAGQVWPPASAVMFALTRPIALLFVGGMVLSLWAERGGRLPVAARIALLAVGLAALVMGEQPAASGALGFAWLEWAGLPALAVFAAAIAGPLKVPLWPLVDLFGKASFALYLLHIPMGWLFAAFYPGALYALGPWFHFAALLGATAAASLAFYHWIERPLTRRLNALTGG